jgi:putative FmdB family regulatory protein
VPVYEYACTECGERLEVRQSFSDDPLSECPACSGRLRKVLSPVGVVFKGSGFYRTDARNGSKSTDAKEPSPVGAAKESSSDSGSSGGSDSKGSTGGAAATSSPSTSSTASTT